MATILRGAVESHHLTSRLRNRLNSGLLAIFGITKGILPGINMLFYLVPPNKTLTPAPANKSLTLLQNYSIDVSIYPIPFIPNRSDGPNRENNERKVLNERRRSVMVLTTSQKLRDKGSIPGSVHGPTVPTRLSRSNWCVTLLTRDEVTKYHLPPDTLDPLPQSLSFD